MRRYFQKEEKKREKRTGQKKSGDQRKLPTDRMYFLLSSGKWERVTVASMRRILGPTYPIRLNAQRHWMRTRLRELNAPVHAIDALLGHGALGQEPYAGYSAYSPGQLRDELKEPIRKLAGIAGWRVVRGLTA